MAITPKVVGKIARFQHNVDGALFAQMYGSDLGKHLWGKYVDYGYNLLKLWVELDLENQRILADRIERCPW